VEEREINAIRSFRADGGVFGIITGRHYHCIHDDLDLLPELETDFVACTSGAMIHDKNGRLISEHRADGSCLRELTEFILESNGLYACFDVSGDFYSVKAGELGVGTAVPIEFTDTVKYFHCTYTKYPDARSADDAVDEIRRRFGKFVSPQRNGTYVDIPPLGCCKATAVKDAAAYFGIDDVMRMYTAGDNLNDMTMFSPWRGIAMERGCDELKNIAFATAENVAAAIDIARKNSSAGE
jgi:hydroxymethylpyrimidine pyrophosphatase-like HAD family hydrolase